MRLHLQAAGTVCAVCGARIVDKNPPIVLLRTGQYRTTYKAIKMPIIDTDYCTVV